MCLIILSRLVQIVQMCFHSPIIRVKNVASWPHLRSCGHEAGRGHEAAQGFVTLLWQQSWSKKDVTTTGALKKDWSFLKQFADDKQVCKITLKPPAFCKSGWLGQRVRVQSVWLSDNLSPWQINSYSFVCNLLPCHKVQLNFKHRPFKPCVIAFTFFFFFTTLWLWS